MIIKMIYQSNTERPNDNLNSDICFLRVSLLFHCIITLYYSLYYYYLSDIITVPSRLKSESRTPATYSTGSFALIVNAWKH